MQFPTNDFRDVDLVEGDQILVRRRPIERWNPRHGLHHTSSSNPPRRGGFALGLPKGSHETRRAANGQKHAVLGRRSARTRHFLPLGQGGAYFIARDGTAPPLRYAIFYSDFATHKTTSIYQLAKALSTSERGLSLAPDGRTLLFVQYDATGVDLTLLEHFR